jgi:hypothetical protein
MTGRYPISGSSRPNHLEDLFYKTFLIERLGQEPIYTKFYGTCDVFPGGIGGQYQDRYSVAIRMGAYLTGRLESIHRGHVQVRDHQIRRVLSYVIERQRAFSEGRDENTASGQRLLDNRQNRGVIVQSDGFRGAPEVVLEEQRAQGCIQSVSVDRFDQISVRLPIEQDRFAFLRHIPGHDDDFGGFLRPLSFSRTCQPFISGMARSASTRSKGCLANWRSAD